MDKRAAEELIRAALRRDDPAACELLWDRYAGELLALLQAVLCSRHDAEDVLQTVFVRIVHKRRYLAAARCLDAYVYQIARHEATSFLRRHRRERVVESDAQPWLVTAEAAVASSREATEMLQTALTRLPPLQRQIVVLKTYQDKTFREIAEMLDVSLNTVASRYRYGMEKLRALLKDVEL
ncbi:MAG: sigma-70 family RNA polymerase sigma factor [Planctomycetes bacterium]|nr:sigma-70 family RNA polymerase sigma factor [Planctomycetota bacterium]